MPDPTPDAASVTREDSELFKTLHQFSCSDGNGNPYLDQDALTYIVRFRLAAEVQHRERAEKAERERDEALRECTKWAREAGEAKGRLETSEMAGVVDGWRERAEAAEQRALAAERELNEYAKTIESFETECTSLQATLAASEQRVRALVGGLTKAAEALQDEADQHACPQADMAAAEARALLPAADGGSGEQR